MLWVPFPDLPGWNINNLYSEVLAENTDNESTAVQIALDRAIKYLLSAQHKERYWEGMFSTDTSITAYYILLMHYLDRVDEARQAKAVRYILNEQQLDGSWNGYPGGRAVLDIMVLDYLARKIHQ